MNIKDAGFTLIELMISITVIGIIIIITTGAMSLGFRSVDAGERKIMALERTRTSVNIIDSQIQSAFILKKSEADSAATKTEFTGGHYQLSFPSHFSLWGEGAGYVMVSYRVAEENGKKVLYASEVHATTGTTRETKLIDDAKEIAFEYFYKGPTDEQGEWVEEWTDGENVPEKVRLIVEKGKSNLSLIIPMRIRNVLENKTAFPTEG
ncbi:MAG: prepilin-type N-terminal cleavage/methylation domain-containing protein [Nitrospirota bacterium]